MKINLAILLLLGIESIQTLSLKQKQTKDDLIQDFIAGESENVMEDEFKSNNDLLKTIEQFKKHTAEVQSLVENMGTEKMNNQQKLHQETNIMTAQDTENMIRNIKKRQNA